MDVNPQQTLIAGGYSQSSLLVGTSSKTPVIVSFDTTTGSYNWQYYLNNLQGRIWFVKYQNLLYARTALIFIPTSSTGPLGIIIISSTSGTVISYQQMASSSDFNQVYCNRQDYDILRLYSQPLIYSSTEMIYMGIDYNTYPDYSSMYFSLLAFSVSPVALTTTWQRRNGMGYSLMCSIIFGKDESQLLAGGYTNIMGTTNPSLQLMQTNDGNLNWRIQTGSILFYNSNGWDFQMITQLFYIQGATPKVVANGDSFECTHNVILIVSLDTSGNYLSNTKFDYQYPGGRCAWGKSIYGKMSGSNVAVYQLAHNLGWATYGFGDGYMYLSTYNSANSYVQVQKITNVGSHFSITSQEMTCAFIASPTQMYFGGVTDKLFDASYSQTFTQPTAFILNTASFGNIITLSLTSSTSLSSGFSYSFTTYSFAQTTSSTVITSSSVNQATINTANNVETLPVTTASYSCNTGTLTLTIAPPTVMSPTVLCEVDVLCLITVGLYGTSPTNCQDIPFIFTLYKNGIAQDGTTFAAFPMTMTTLSNDIELSITPTSSMLSMSYTLMIYAILDQQPQLSDSSYAFTLNINNPAINPPGIANSVVTGYPSYPFIVYLGQYCFGSSPTLAECQAQSFSYSLIINGTSQTYSSFPMNIVNTQNDITLTITPPLALSSSTTSVVVKSLITSIPSVFEQSYNFNLVIYWPSIVAPLVSSSLVLCWTEQNCSITIGTYSLAPLPGLTLSYSFTQNSQSVTPLSYQFYQMDLDTTSNSLTFYYYPLKVQAEGSYLIQITANILEFPSISDSSYIFTVQVQKSCDSLEIIGSPIIQNITYQVGSDPYIFAFDKFQLSDESCRSYANTSLYFLEDGAVGNKKFTSDFGYYDFTLNRRISVFTNNSDLIGFHLLTVVCTIFIGTPSAKSTFVNSLVEIYNTSSAYSKVPSSGDTSFSVDDQVIQAEVKTLRPVGRQVTDDVTLKFYFGAMSNFSSFDPATLNFTFTPNEYDVGVYTVKGALVSTQINTKVDFKFTLTVVAQPEKDKNISTAAPPPTLNVPIAEVESKVIVKNDNMSLRGIAGTITKISSIGVMTIKFNSSVIAMKDIGTWTSDDMQISLAYATNASTATVNYTLISVVEKILTIQLNFERPEEISPFSVSIGFARPFRNGIRSMQSLIIEASLSQVESAGLGICLKITDSLEAFLRKQAAQVNNSTVKAQILSFLKWSRLQLQQ